MANITRELQAIEEAIYGEEVRGSIHDAISKINDVSESSDTTAQNANITAESAKATAQNAEKIAEIKSGTAVTSVTSPITGIVKGEMYFNTNTNDLWKCNGVGWDLIGNLKGVKGDKGEDAPKPTGIVLVSQVGLIKTYNITFSDGSTFPFQVSDGASGTGTGDMLKAVYDRDNSGVIDAAETLVEKTSGKIGQTAVLVQLTKDTDGDLNFEGKKIKGEGGTGGATLRITTTEPDFIGKAVRATLQSGSTSSAYFMTSTFDDDGKCEITVNEVGTYKISVTDDKEYSVTKDIPYFGIYTGIMLAKFRANIPVTVNGGVSVGEGAIVTASDGTATYTATTGIDGTCTIQVGKSGVYTIKATKGGVTTDSTGTSTISTNGQTASLVTLSFASITLNYTCESSITYEVKKGTFSKTGADTSSGSETFLVPSLGEYQIICTIDGNQVTASVNLTSYANKSASVQAPAGGFSGWVKTRFPSSTATSLSDLTEAQIRELMTVHTAQDKLYEWLSATPADFSQFASNRVAMKWIGLRDRICDKLMGVSTILTAMLSSTHWEYILKDSVPTMTSDSLPEGTVSKSGEMTNFNAWKVFDRSTSTFWEVQTTTCWISYKFNYPINVKRIGFTLYANYSPKDFTLEVSKDGNSYEQIASYTNNYNDERVVYFDVDSDEYYLAFKLNFSSGYATKDYAIKGINFYGRALNESVPVMTDNTLPIGECFASSEQTSNPAWYAFINKAYYDTGGGFAWKSNNTNYPCHIGYDFKKPIVAKSFVVQSGTGGGKELLKNFEIIARNSSSEEWTTLGSYTAQGVAFGIERYSINNDVAYKQYALNLKDSNVSTNAEICWLNFYGVSYSEEEFGTDGIEMLYDNGVKLVSGEWQKTSTTHSTITFDVADDYVLVNDPSATSGVNGRVGLVYENNNLKTQVAEVYDREGTLAGGYLENWNNPSGTNEAESVTNILTNKGIDKNADITRAICVQDVSNFSGTRFACFVTASANVGTFKIAKLYFLK